MKIFYGIHLLSGQLLVIITISSVSCTDVCTTEGCRSAAKMLLESMDRSVEPCENFYQYACGNWNKHHPIKRNKYSTSFLTVLMDNLDVVLKSILEEKSDDSPSETEAKTLYRSCLNEDAVHERGNKDIWDFLEEMGGMPLLGMRRGGGWNEDNYNLEDLSAKTRTSVLFDMSVKENLVQSSRHAMWISQGDYGLPDDSYYQKGINDKIMEAYTKYLIGLAKLLGANNADATREIYNVVQLEMSLAKKIEGMDLGSTARTNISELTSEIEKFDWMQYFKKVGASDIQPGDDVILSGWNGIKRRLEILQYTPRRTIANLILLRLVKDRINILPRSFRENGLGLLRALTGQEADGSLWKRCVSYVNEKMPLVLGKKYINREFTAMTKNMVTEMTHELKGELKSIIESTKWLDEETRAKAIEKVELMGVHIGYPDSIMNATYINDIYKEYKFKNNQMFKNDILIRELKFKEMLAKLRANVDVEDWPVSPSTVNAFNHFVRNQIYIPAGIIQPPLFNLMYPKYVNYGMIGKIIGHEIAHGLDIKGINFDKTGNIGTWWTQTSLMTFLMSAQCIITQYSNYRDTEANMNLNGGKTSADDISDNSGLKMAYKAFKQTESLRRAKAGLPGLDLNRDQIFFLSAAHLWCTESRPEATALKIITGSHSPGRYRVIGPMQNNEDFANAFNCTLGSYMNPKEKCTVW